MTSNCVYTRAEIIVIIKDLDAAIIAIGVRKSYELDTGQGRQKVMYQDMDKIVKLRDSWISELRCLDGNLMSMNVTRQIGHGHR